ncbi:MAG: DUF1524 domain-containing protein, partial [Fibrobacter sp.]|nr:DUF1524 domain-containing protein [Fibrobacter sp.]
MKLKALHKSDGADDAGNKEAFMEEIDEMYASIKAVAEKWWQPENLGYMPWIDVGEPIRTYMYVVLSGLDSARNEDIRKGTESFFNEYFNRDLRQNEILEPENAWHEVHAAFESFRRFYNSVYVDSTKVCHDAKHLAVDLIWHTRYWSYWAVVPAFYHLNGNELEKALEDGLLLAKLLLVYSVINDKRVKEIDGEVLRYLRMQKEGKRDEYRAAVLDKLAGETKNRFKDQIAKNIYNNRKKAMNLLFLSAALDELWDGSSPQNIRYRIYYAYCGSQAKSESERKPSALDFDHIQPRSLGGDWDNELLNGLGNLVAIESSKNRSFNDALPNSK